MVREISEKQRPALRSPHGPTRPEDTLPPRETIHKLDFQIRKTIHVLKSEVRKRTDKLPFPARMGKTADLLHFESGKAVGDLNFYVGKARNNLYFAIHVFAVATTVPPRQRRFAQGGASLFCSPGNCTQKASGAYAHTACKYRRLAVRSSLSAEKWVCLCWFYCCFYLFMDSSFLMIRWPQ